jgi:alanine racemase
VYREAWLEIDLAAMRANVVRIRSVVAAARVAPVIKADAYGHGLLAAAGALGPVSDALCVATLDEGLALRPGYDGRILVLYPVPAEGVPDAAAARLEPVILSRHDLETVRSSVRPPGSVVRLHLGIDTGMGRGGLPVDQVAAVAEEVLASPGLEVAGLWSHLYSPEAPATASAQLARFEAAATGMRSAGITVPLRHIAASGGIFARHDAVYDLVRPGLAVYGYLDPELVVTEAAAEAARGLRPAMTLKARAVAFSEVAEGETVGYGGTWRAPRPSRVALLPVGYGDGYLRSSQPGGWALVHGRRIPLVGRVSMDSVTADVTDLPGVRAGDEFVLLGRQGSESISAADLARQRNTIAWEVLATMARRLARVYHPTTGTDG